MATPNHVFIKQAKEILKGNWRLAIGGYLLYYLLSIVPILIPQIGVFYTIIAGGPFCYGITSFLLAISRNKKVSVISIFTGFEFKNLGRSIGAYFLMVFYMLVGLVLFIIPGVIAFYSYALTFYILVDNPSVGISAALQKSQQLMRGNKKRLFMLGLPFVIFPVFLVFFELTYSIFFSKQIIRINFLPIPYSLEWKVVIKVIEICYAPIYTWLCLASSKFYDDLKLKAIETENA